MTDSVYERARALAVHYPFSISDLIVARSRMEAYLVDTLGVHAEKAAELADDFMELAAAIGVAASIKPALVFEKLKMRGVGR